MFRTFIKKIYNDKVGNVLAVTSIAAPVMIGFAGLSIDVGYGIYSKSQLRGSTELTALDIAENYTASNNFTFWNAAVRDQAPLIENAISISKGGLPTNHGDVAIKPEDVEIGEWDIESKTFTPGVSGPIVNAARVKGELSDERQNKISTFFGGIFGFNPDIDTESFAVAPLIPHFHLLDPHASGALRHTFGNGGDDTDIDLGDIWINSDADDAMIASPIEHKFGATGAYIKGGSTIAREGRYHENVFRLPDLIAKQSEPSTPYLCDFQDHVLNTNEKIVLEPGTYCGGLAIHNSDDVTFNPGNYHFVDGPLWIRGADKVSGSDILFHFDGPWARLVVQQSKLFLSGRHSGAHKGFLVFSSRTSTRTSNNYRVPHHFYEVNADFAGLIYAPDNDIYMYDSNINGKCHSLCLVANTMTVALNSYLNWYPDYPLTGPLQDEPRIAPTALEPYLSPYIIS